MPARSSRAEVMDREARAIELRRNGASYPQIAERLGISEAGARKIVKRALDRHITEAVPDVRKLELDRLDVLQRTALLVMGRTHYVVSGGKVVYTTPGDGGRPAPMVDDGPTLAALDRLLAIQVRRARLLGLDAPRQVDVKVFTIDQMDARIQELEALLAANDQTPQPGVREPA